MNVPTWWEFLLLTLGAFRVWRIFARDSITEEAREALTGYDDDHAPALREKDAPPPPTKPTPPGWEDHGMGGAALGVYLSALIRCPWCLGFYVSVATAAAWWAAPRVTLLVATPLALSAALALVKKNLDRDE